MKISVYNKFTDDLKGYWRKISCTENNLGFQDYYWLSNWQESVGGKDNSNNLFIIVVCLDDDSPLVIFPFNLRVVLKIRILEFLGRGQCDYNSPIINYSKVDKHLITNIWQEVRKVLPKHDIKFFLRLPNLIHGNNNLFSNIFNSKPGPISYQAVLPNSWEDYRLSISSKIIKDNARMRRRLCEKGSLTFINEPTVNLSQKFVEFIIKQKTFKYKETGARNQLSSQRVRDFYSNTVNLKKISSDNFSIHISGLMLDDEIIAAHLGFTSGNQFYYLMPAYSNDIRFAKFSIGRLLLENLIKWSIESDYQVFDFTTGSELYKDIWCNSTNLTKNYIYAKTISGKVFMYCYFGISWLKNNSKTREVILKIVRLYNKFF
jgi:CelD/BcsL family acetyltransferase involved in cellulose biosynthesis